MPASHAACPAARVVGPGSSGVEQGIENPRVGGSNPPPGTIYLVDDGEMPLTGRRQSHRSTKLLHNRAPRLIENPQYTGKNRRPDCYTKLVHTLPGGLIAVYMADQRRQASPKYLARLNRGRRARDLSHFPTGSRNFCGTRARTRTGPAFIRFVIIFVANCGSLVSIMRSRRRSAAGRAAYRVEIAFRKTVAVVIVSGCSATQPIVCFLHRTIFLIRADE